MPGGGADTLCNTTTCEQVGAAESTGDRDDLDAGIQKWKHKLEEAKEQESFPVKD